MLSKYELKPIYDYVISTNPSNDLPYHNNNHIVRVCEFAIMGAEYYKLSENDIRLLIVACLFHDYNHTGSGANDDININNAITSLKEYMSTDIKRYHLYFTKEEIDKICNIIQSTRYPEIREPSNRLEKIICDADILQGFFVDNYINDTVFKIADENNITHQQMINGQPNFLNSRKFHTKWASNLYATIQDKLLKLASSYEF